MSDYVTIKHPVMGDVQLRKDLVGTLTPVQFNRLVVEQAAKYVKENDIDIDPFATHFVNEVTSTMRGIQELTGMGEFSEDNRDKQRTTSMLRDFKAEVALSSDPVWGYTGLVTGAILDPVTLPLAFTKLLKLGRIADMAVGGMASGAVGGVLSPIREEYGESRQQHLMYGAAFGAALGTGLGVLFRKWGVDNAADAQKLYNEASDSVKKQMEADATNLSENPDFKSAAEKAKHEKSEEQSLLNTKEEVTPQKVAEEQAKVAQRKYVNEQLDAEKKQADTNIQNEAQKMRDEAETLPDLGTRKANDGQVRSLEKQLGQLDEQIAGLKRAKQATKANKKATGKTNRRRAKAIDERIQATEIHKADVEASLEPMRQRQRDYRALETTRKDIEAYDATGELPARLKDLTFNDPRVTRQEAPFKEPARPDVPQGAIDPLTQGGQGPFAVSPTRQSVQAANVTPPVAPVLPPKTPTQSPAPTPTPTASASPTPAAGLPTQTPRQKPQGKVAQTLDYYLGSLSTRLRERFPTIYLRLQKYETHIQQVGQRRIRESEPFFKELKQLPPNLKQAVELALMNGRFDIVNELLPPHMLKHLGVIRKELKAIHAELKSRGIDVAHRDNYFPRRVKDLKGLREALGREHDGAFTKAIEEFKVKNGLKELTPDQEAEIINKVVQGIFKDKSRISVGSVGKRSVNDIPLEYIKFYEDPASALTHYYRTMTELTAKYDFFGKSVVRNVTTDANGKEVVDVSVRNDESVGNMIGDALVRYDASNDEQQELIQMLGARFIEGEKGMHALMAGYRDVGYATTIANVMSAILNLTDIATSAALHGIRNTIASMFGKMNGNKYNMIQMGIDHTIAHELQDNRTTAKALQRLFKWSGFASVDMYVKNTAINAAMRKHEALAKTEKGRAKLRKEWGRYYEGDTEALINDLRLGNVTENTKLLAFNEITDLQPTALSQHPEAYLRNPNWRIVYTLKSFTLKQLDIVRRKVVQEAAKGNPVTAAKNLFLLSTFFTAADMGVRTVQDWIQGKDMNPEDIPTRAMWTLFGVAGMNQYVYERYLSQGDLYGGLVATLAPPKAAWDGVTKLKRETTKMLKGEEYNFAKAARAVPIAGPLIYSLYGGGAALHNERLAKED